MRRSKQADSLASMPADHPAGPHSNKMGSMGKTAMKTLKLSVEETRNLTMD